MSEPTNATARQTDRSSPLSRPTVGLFVTCLVDTIRPQTGFAALRLLENAGCDVVVPQTQTCCGQPAFNAGATSDAAALARQTIAAFEPFDYLVAPSGSCAAMIKVHYPEALKDDPAWLTRAQALAAKTFELLSFLADVMAFTPNGISLEASATYHDSCSGLRELAIASQPRRLLAAIDGLTLMPLGDATTCCGFGGTFCVKYSDISTAIADDKVAAVNATGADLLLGGDLGCLMNISGRLSRTGSAVRVMHAADVLAGMGEGPALGEDT